VDAITLVKRLKLPAVVIDRFRKELAYDMLAVLKESLGDLLAGVILNDIPAEFMDELEALILPFFASRGIGVLGVIPRTAGLGAVTVADLCARLGGKIVSAHAGTERAVDTFLIGTMQVENFLTHFRRRRNAAVIVGGDRSDIQLVALEGDCPCLVLTGNLFPNDIILTRAEVLGTPIVMVREDTYSVARKMEDSLARHKLRGAAKLELGTKLVAEHLDFAQIKRALGL
jgi:BioD-like phosphotransacetylase family protein